jgi:ATP-dependent helicase/nuclease subunit B
MQVTERNRSFIIPSCAEFPNTISSTAVELLLQNPYSFYAKKILKLKHLDRFKDHPNLADFGIFIHAVLDRYTTSYQIGSYQEQISRFLSIAKAVLQEMNFQTQDLWVHKIEGVAEEFIDFDSSRRSPLCKVWSEQKGSVVLDLAQCQIKLTSIADRIESLGEDVFIIDYKTGVVPNEADVRMGIAPQLIVSSIIASRGGFACLNGPRIPAKIVYVKLASCSPYWRVSDIVLGEGDLDLHLDQLISLLELLMSQVELKLSPRGDSFREYDEYAHLSRVCSSLDFK